jgi:hypothetical protein
MDASQTSAAANIAGGFNPLNAGRDKSEAKRVLGRKASVAQEPSEPFYQRIWFLVAALMFTAAAAIWMALPPSAGDLVRRSRALLLSTNPADWQTVTESMRRVKESESKFALEAEEIYLRAKRRILLDLANRGIKNKNFHAPTTRLFVEAYALEQNEEAEQAKALYADLVRAVDPAGPKAYLYHEARDRFRKLAGKIKLPETADMLLALINQAKQARTEQELTFSKRVLTKIYVEKTGESDLEEVVDQAKETLELLQQKLNLLAEAKNSPPFSESVNPTSDSTQDGSYPGVNNAQTMLDESVDGQPSRGAIE